MLYFLLLQISKLKNIELINNTKNVTTNLQRSTKILTSTTRDAVADEGTKISASLKSIHQQLKALDIPEVHNDCMNCMIDENGQFATLLTTTNKLNVTKNLNASSSPTPSSLELSELKMMTTTVPPIPAASDVSDHLEEQHLSQELTQHLNTKAIQEANKQTDLHNHHSHSDSDSALSSAPPSISPQPPANGEEPTDIWQTVR